MRTLRPALLRWVYPLVELKDGVSAVVLHPCAPLELLDLHLATCCHVRVRPQDALLSSFSTVGLVKVTPHLMACWRIYYGVSEKKL